ncbi:MAG: DNA repair protein RecO [Planctomycetes bacterium]|nr:DNA repair protein RecO [Planctomycetota bacterium]
MALVTDDAVTLTASDYSETSQIVSLLTRQNGKVRLIAKGSKRPKSAFGGPIDRLEVVQAVFTVQHRGGLGQLTELTVTDPLPGLRGNLRAFYAASCMAELLVGATQELDPHPELFKIAVETLQRLSCGGDSAILMYRFEARMLRILGLMPELRTCVACRRPRPQGRSGIFSAAAGGLVCRQCMDEHGQGLAVTGKALDALGFLAAADDKQVERVTVSSQTTNDIRRLLREYWQHVLGRPVRAMKYL